MRWALASGEPLEVVGGGTKRAIGEPAQVAATLETGALDGIVSYEPEELVLCVRPGAALDDLRGTVHAAGQTFAFEPPDFAPLLNSEGMGTIGGVYATNLSGPRRIASGAVRDHALGIEAVSGRGEVFRAGGKVVKNVTGYDLARALAGSWGTLAIATELTLKMMPRPQAEATLVYEGRDPAAAVALMAAAMGSTADVSGAAHVSETVAGAIGGLAARAATLLRIEGFGPSVAARQRTLKDLLGTPEGTLEAAGSAAVWSAIRDARPFADRPGTVWRCSVAPSAAPRLLAAVPAGSDALLDWAGGLVTLLVPPEAPDGRAAVIRGAVEATGGHALLLRAPFAVRSRVPTFQPQSSALAALSERLRQGFDPQGVLNPARMVRPEARA